MVDPISKPAGFGDAALDSKVIEEYADGLDALTMEECLDADRGISKVQCEALTEVLGTGPDGNVTDDEKSKLAQVGFSESFINALAGQNGKMALYERVKWLGEHAVKIWLQPYVDAYEQQVVMKELGDIGPDAADAVPALIEVLKDSKWVGHVRWDVSVKIGAYAAAEALGKIGAPAVPALIEALKDEDSYVRWDATWALGEIGAPAAKYAIPTLEKMRDNDPNADCRKAAKEAIEKIAGE